jgi:methylmalonyl-CoA mutase
MRIAQNWAKRSANLASRREAVTGVSEFPNLAEQPVVRDPAPARPRGGLPRVRRSAGYETLRSRSDVLLAITGARPRIALVALGPAAVHTGRSTFAANLFQAGGIEPVLIEGGLSETGLAGGDRSEEPAGQPDLAALAALADSFAASGARVACICSSDALYAACAQDAAAALKAAGALWVVLAGRPGDRRAAYQQAGVDAFVYAGCDALTALTTVLDQIGAAR